MQSWYGGIQLANVKPQHSQSQDLVVRVHNIMQYKLTVEIYRVKENTSQWSKWLPRIVCMFHLCCVSVAN